MKRIFSFGAAAILLAGLLLSLNVPGNPPEATSPNEPSQTEPIDSAALDNSDLLFQQYRAEQIARMPMDSTGALDLQAWGRDACNDSLFNALAEQFAKLPHTESYFLNDINNMMILFYGVNYRSDNASLLMREQEFELNFRKGNYKKAFQIAQEILKFAPASPHVLDVTAFLQFKLDSTAKEAIQSYQARAMWCLFAMDILGDGSQQAPILITNVSDEYFYLARKLKVFKIEGQEMITNPITGAECDVLTLSEEDAKRLGRDAIWFDADFSMQRMWRLLNTPSDSD